MSIGSKFHLVTLGCPKNEVDSEKIAGTLFAEGMKSTDDLNDADLIVVNTCAFVEEAREESIETILNIAELRNEESKIVVTGCMAERYGKEMQDSLPEVDHVAGFGVPVSLTRKADVPELDLLNLPRPASGKPWAYLKIAEGCDRACGYCSIPSFRGPQRSRSISSIIEEVDALEVKEVVLVAQDLAAFGRDQGIGEKSVIPLIEEIVKKVEWVRLLYLYPSELNQRLIDVISCLTVPYFDLSLQHVSPPLLRKMKRWGSDARFRDLIFRIRENCPEAVFRSNFIVGYPGETEEDHDQLIEFIQEMRLDWCGFFPFSNEEGTYASDLDGKVDRSLIVERLKELGSLQDEITASKRDALIGEKVSVLVDSFGVGRTYREAPEIDGIVSVPDSCKVGEFVDLIVKGATGPDLEADLL
ncbi:MAG: 30S ribosomal protein S12 methylthiotransferase RimO [Actinomycetota bacterium]|nr:30S ribosomal protein S12 methylthiotransferase RimO [Actinomycetota bacterium]|tara:strand:+ start:10892 stop:12136 length:1245 start_codon:yes stop_codon:yes gene_type:complete